MNELTKKKVEGIIKLNEVSLDDAWQWIGYSTKQKARQKLESYLEEGVDFNLIQTVKVQTEGDRVIKRPYTEITMTPSAFKELAMVARTQKGREVRKYFIECENTLRELHNQGITSDYRLSEDISELKEKVNYLTATIMTCNSVIENSNLSEHDMFAPESGGFYRKEINRLVHGRARDKKKRTADVWLELYANYKRQTGIDPVVMADMSGIGIIDYIAFTGRLKVLYEIMVDMCTPVVMERIEGGCYDGMSLDDV